MWTEVTQGPIGNGENLHPNTITWSPADRDRIVLPFNSPIHWSLLQLDIEPDNLLPKVSQLQVSRELLVKRDTTEYAFRLGELEVQKQGGNTPLKWSLGYDTLVLGKTTTIEEQFRTESFTVQQGMNLKYRVADKRKGIHPLASGLALQISLRDASTNQVLGVLGTLQLNNMQQGRRVNVMNANLNQHNGKAVYMQMSLLGMDTTALYYLRNYNHPAGVSLPKEGEDDMNQWLSVPSEVTLSQNYPNPFNPSTEITFSIPLSDHVSLKVFDALGREVRELVNEKKDAGFHIATFDGSTFPSGVYFYRLLVNGTMLSRRMNLVK